MSEQKGRRATLDDIPDSALERFAEMGFDYIWFLSVWSTGEAAKNISRKNPEWRREFEDTLPDLREEDIAGSGFAVTGYTVHPDLGGDEALRRLRERLREHGLRLMLDFVPNHMAPDHPWVEQHPEYFVHGTAENLERSPENYTRLKTQSGDFILAYGRDPYFAGWPDTLQLDYSNPSVIEAMTGELLRISNQCDGVRCDMAMLVLPEVFEKTWGRKALPFWQSVTQAVHEKKPEFIFMAEVYWDLEWNLQQLGFDYTYDKRLYDRLRKGNTLAIRQHFFADADYQNKSARFLENHDEPRAASVFEIPVHRSAAIITFFCPGLRFFHQGQFEGGKKRISPHLVRAPHEAVNAELQTFYFNLLDIIRKPLFRNGQWRLLNCLAAWEGNESCESFLAFAWEGSDDERILVAVNFSQHASQCYIPLPFPEFAEQPVQFLDLMSAAVYDRKGNDVLSTGLYLDLKAWGYHIFEVTAPASVLAEKTSITHAPRHDMITV
ncbi:MAG TPA: alpha-amylase family glycosyl hydrolase [Puia sp.]|nr:alpha-amylase family glycosyl hydrolase [Puia sp.]